MDNFDAEYNEIFAEMDALAESSIDQDMQDRAYEQWSLSSDTQSRDAASAQLQDFTASIDWDSLDIPERIDTPEENARLDAMRIATCRGML
jgi:hypothetical protein